MKPIPSSIFIITEYNLMNNLILSNPPITLYSLNELQNRIHLVFPNQKTYLTKEEDSNESLIKSTTDETKLLHVLNLDNTQL